MNQMAIKQWKMGMLLMLAISLLYSCGGGGEGSSAPSAASLGKGLYFTGIGKIMKVGLNGGTAIINYPPGPMGIAVDSTYVYWFSKCDGASCSTTGTINKVSINGGPETTLVSGIAYHAFSRFHLAVDDTSIYYIEDPGGGGKGTIKKVGKSGGPITTLASGLPSPVSLTIDTLSVYWSDRTGKVGKADKNGGGVTILNSTGAPAGIAVDNTSVYWTDNAGGGLGAVKKVGINGGTVTTLASGLNTPEPIALDDTSVYWVENGINKVDKNGGNVTILAPNQINAGGVTVDDTNVYWFNTCDRPFSTDSDVTTVNKVGRNGGTMINIASALPCINQMANQVQ